MTHQCCPTSLDAFGLIPNLWEADAAIDSGFEQTLSDFFRIRHTEV